MTNRVPPLRIHLPISHLPDLVNHDPQALRRRADELAVAAGPSLATAVAFPPLLSIQALAALQGATISRESPPCAGFSRPSAAFAKPIEPTSVEFSEPRK
ncbi:MAG: hypothetical protein K9G48_13885 [Reyranella sp.]|nr:hypothetical protein [Reyranella sp.]